MSGGVDGDSVGLDGVEASGGYGAVVCQAGTVDGECVVFAVGLEEIAYVAVLLRCSSGDIDAGECHGGCVTAEFFAASLYVVGAASGGDTAAYAVEHLEGSVVSGFVDGLCGLKIEQAVFGDVDTYLYAFAFGYGVALRAADELVELVEKGCGPTLVGRRDIEAEGDGRAEVGVHCVDGEVVEYASVVVNGAVDFNRLKD